MLPFEGYQDALELAKRPVLYFHSLTDLKEWPRLARKAGTNSSLNGGNFGIVNGSRAFACSHNPDNPRCRKDGEPVLRIEPGKNITGEERKLNSLDSVRPRAPRFIKREKPLIAFAAEDF